MQHFKNYIIIITEVEISAILSNFLYSLTLLSSVSRPHLYESSLQVYPSMQPDLTLGYGKFTATGLLGFRFICGTNLPLLTKYMPCCSS